MLEFSTVTTPVAKKQYKCSLCGRAINKGEKYSRFEGKNDGEMFSEKHHLFCVDIIDKYCRWAGDQEYDVDSVLEWAHEFGCADCPHAPWKEDDCDKSVFDCDIARKALGKEQGHD